MKLDNETIHILKNFTTINQSIVFKPGTVLSTMSPSKTIMAKAQIAEEIPSTFAVYDLSRMLGTVSLFNNPTIDLHDKYMTISEGKRKINYTFTEPSLVVSPPEKDIKFPEPEVTFILTESTLSEVGKALSVLSLPEFAVTGDGEHVYVQALDSKNPSGDIYSVEVGDTSDKFRMIISAENLKVLPNDYEVKISSQGLSHFKSPKIEYYVAVESSSHFGEPK